MSRKVNIFGGIKVWGRFNFTWPRANFREFFNAIKGWDWAAWFWFILLAGIVAMGIGAVLVQMFGDPTPVVPAAGGWDG